MKNILTILLICLSSIVFGQQVKPNNDKVLKDTVISSVSYKLYQGSRGGKYVLRTSKSGNIYKQYIKK